MNAERPSMDRAWRWARVRQANNKFLEKVSEEDKYFNFRPYTFMPRGIATLSLFSSGFIIGIVTSP